MKHQYKVLIAALLLTLCLSASRAGGQETEAQQYSEAGQKALANGNYVEAHRLTKSYEIWSPELQRCTPISG